MCGQRQWKKARTFAYPGIQYRSNCIHISRKAVTAPRMLQDSPNQHSTPPLGQSLFAIGLLSRFPSSLSPRVLGISFLFLLFTSLASISSLPPPSFATLSFFFDIEHCFFSINLDCSRYRCRFDMGSFGLWCLCLLWRWRSGPLQGFCVLHYAF